MIHICKTYDCWKHIFECPPLGYGGYYSEQLPGRRSRAELTPPCSYAW